MKNSNNSLRLTCKEYWRNMKISIFRDFEKKNNSCPILILNSRHWVSMQILKKIRPANFDISPIVICDRSPTIEKRWSNMKITGFGLNNSYTGLMA